MSEDWLLEFENKEAIERLVNDLKEGIFLSSYQVGRSYLKYLVFRTRDVLLSEAKGRVFIFGALKFMSILFWGQNFEHKTLVEMLGANPEMISILRNSEWDHFEAFFQNCLDPERKLSKPHRSDDQPRLSPFASFMGGIPRKGTMSRWLKVFSKAYEKLLCTDYEAAIARQKETKRKIKLLEFLSYYPSSGLIRNIIAHFNSNCAIDLKPCNYFGEGKGKIGGIWLGFSAKLSGKLEQYSAFAFYSFHADQIIETLVSPQGQEEDYLREFFASTRPRSLGVSLDSIYFTEIQSAYATYSKQVDIVQRPECIDFPVAGFDLWEPCYQKAFEGASFESLEAATQAVRRLQACFQLFELSTGDKHR